MLGNALTAALLDRMRGEVEVHWTVSSDFEHDAFIAEGLATGFGGVFVVGMLDKHYRGFADKHGLPDVAVVDLRTLGPDDFSLATDVTRSEAFWKIFDACRAHGVLGSGDEELLVGALHNLKRGVTDLIEALEISNVVPLGGGVFKVRGNPRACEKLKAWPADLPAAVALRNALAPLMRVDAFLEACKFVPVADSAQIKLRTRLLLDSRTGPGRSPHCHPPPSTTTGPSLR